MKIKLLLLQILVLLTSSCSQMFEESGASTGYMRAHITGDFLPATTEELQVRYYDNYSDLEYNNKLGEPDYFSSDNSFLSNIPSGKYKILVYNKFNNKIRNYSDLSKIVITADTIYSQKWGCEVISTSQKPVYRSISEGLIMPSDTTAINFRLLPMVQKIIINVSLKGIAVSTDRISSIQAMLSGVITGRKIYTNQTLPEYAGQEFSFVSSSESHYTASAYVFGISQKVSNTLKFELAGDTFHQNTSVDLSTVLKDFTSEGMVIDLVVEIGENMEMSNIYIEKWIDINQTNIKF